MHYFTKYICATYFYITFYRDNFYNSNSWRTCYYGLWTGILTRSNSLKFILLMCENCLTSPFMAINISVHKIKSFIILCRSYQEGCGIPVVEDPTGSWGWGSSSCSWPSYCKSARFWLDIWWNSSQSNKEKKKGKKKRYQQTRILVHTVLCNTGALWRPTYSSAVTESWDAFLAVAPLTSISVGGTAGAVWEAVTSLIHRG